MQKNAIGYELIAEQQDLEIQLMHAGRIGLLSLIEACIHGEWNTEEAILAKVQQIGGPNYATEVAELLTTHASPLARPQLWRIDNDGYYELVRQTVDLETTDYWLSYGREQLRKGAPVHQL